MQVNVPTIESINELIRTIGNAHQQATGMFRENDPEWPLWFAKQLKEPLTDLFKTDFSLSQLIYCLMDAELERLALKPDEEWPQYYAEHFLARYAAPLTPESDKLALYMTPWCPFCVRVLNTIESLGIDVERRDIGANRADYEALVTARHRATVPVLRITSPGGGDRWMPESRDIVQYLKKTYG